MNRLATILRSSRTASSRGLARLALLLLLPLLVANASFAQGVTFGPSLVEALSAAGSTEPLEVIVTFDQDDPLTAAQRLALEGLGLSGVYFQSLPMAGVLATPSQIDAIAGLDGVRSIWYNDALEYENAEATALTGVDDARTDAQFRSMNGGLPVSGRGVGVLINDSGVDGTHDDIKSPSHLIQNVAGQLSLRNEVGLLPALLPLPAPNRGSRLALDCRSTAAGAAVPQRLDPAGRLNDWRRRTRW